jgi:hypothetical protein
MQRTIFLVEHLAILAGGVYFLIGALQRCAVRSINPFWMSSAFANVEGIKRISFGWGDTRCAASADPQELFTLMLMDKREIKR